MKPSIGRIVHFVQFKPEGYGEGFNHLPAIITQVWSDTCVNLQVFTDGTNSEGSRIPNNSPQGIKRVTSVCYDEKAEQPYTWHWPEKVE